MWVLFISLTILIRCSLELECTQGDQTTLTNAACGSNQTFCYVFSDFTAVNLPPFGCATNKLDTTANCVTCDSARITNLANSNCNGNTITGTQCCCSENNCNSDFATCQKMVQGNGGGGNPTPTSQGGGVGSNKNVNLLMQAMLILLLVMSLV